MISISDGRNELYQWDTGSTLTVDADCSQVHFSNKVFGRSIDVDVVDSVAIIPDILLQTDKDLTAWAFVGTAENGYTKISRTFKVNRRNKPADYVFTPTDQTSLEEIKEKLDYLESIQDPDAIKDAVEDYLERNPVEAPVQSVNGHTGDVELTAEDVGARPDTWIPTAAEVGALPSKTVIPKKTSDLINDSGFITQYTETDPTVPAWAKQPQKPSYTAAEVGALSQNQLQSGINTALAQAKASGEFDGADGQSGKDGVDGYSPAAKVTQTATGATVTITDKNGTTTATIANGKDGKDGADGYTPQKGIDYFDGQPGTDGKDGADGKNGTSVTVKSVSESTADGGNNVVTFSDGKTLTVMNGSKGSPGDDYVLTAADKEEIAEQAASLVEVPEATMEPLTFTGAVNATYDGSKAVSVEIPKGSGGSGGGTEKEWVLITDTVLTEAAHSVTFTQLPNGEAFGFSELMVYGAAVCNVGTTIRSFGILANGKWIAQIPESVHKAGADISAKLFFYKGIIENGTINGISTNSTSLAQQVSGRNTLSMVTLVDYEKINSVRVEPNTSADDFGAGTWFRIFGR